MRGLSRNKRMLIAMGVVAALASACGPPPNPGTPPLDPGRPITLGHANVPGDASARSASTSANGTWTAFSSSATNLVAGDTNGIDDVFLRNNSTGSVVRVATGSIDTPTISRNGRYVGFKGSAGFSSFGVYDRVTATTTAWTELGDLSVPVVTDDGAHAVQGVGGTFGLFAAYCRIRDLSANTAVNCPPGSPDYGVVSLVGHSGNGRYVMYHWNDQSGGGTSSYFLYDLVTSVRTPLTGTFMGIGINNIVSDDGTTILGAGFGTGLPTMIHDVAAGTSEMFPGEPEGNAVPLGISPDGRYMGLVTDATNLDPADTNGAVDVYLLDRSDDTVTRVSMSFDTGEQLSSGATLCGKVSGQVLDGGRVCVMALDEISTADANGFLDAFMTPSRP